MAQYSAVFTTYGTQQLAKAIANNKPLTVTHFAVGDGNGNAVTVSASQERLVNEKYRATISAVSLDPRNNKQVIFELTIPEDIGGFYIREMGVFDANNKLVAYANCPESFKPTLASGSGKVQVMRMILLVASSNAVTLTVDDSVIFVTRGQLTPQTITANSANGVDQSGHSHAIDKASTTNAGIVQLTNDTGLDSENLGLTAKAGKVLAQGIAALRLALNNYIPNSKKSSRVDSNSADDVATSAAAKTAYDKGVEAKNAADNAQRSANDGINRANNAQQTANSANDNADSRVAKSGDTMTGNLTVPNLIVNDPTNNNNFVQIGDDTKLIDVDMGHTVGLQTKDNANDAYIAYGATKKRFGFDGNMFFADAALATNHIGHGSYAQQYNVAAPFYVHQTLSVARDTYHPFVKGRVRAAGQYGAAFSFGYTTNQNRGSDGYGTGVIHLISDAGAERLWRFGHNGEFASAGDVITSAGRSLNSAIYRDEGNPHDIAISWLSNGLKVRVDATDLGRVAFQQDIHNALRGAVCAFAMGHPPAGWLKCNGAAVSRTAYADLFSIIGTHYGAGDGHSTFNLPDLRGEFIRGIDEGRGADPNRAFGSWQSDEIRSHNHFIQFDGVAAGRRGAAEGAIHSGSGKPYYTDHTGGNETRPRNVALLYCIKY